MITKENIMQVLECGDIYAQKLIAEAEGDEKELVNIINQKLTERCIRPAYGVVEISKNQTTIFDFI